MTVPTRTCPACGLQLTEQGCPQHGWSYASAGGAQSGYATDQSVSSDQAPQQQWQPTASTEQSYGGQQPEHSSPAYGADPGHTVDPGHGADSGYGSHSAYGSGYGSQSAYGADSGYSGGSTYGTGPEQSRSSNGTGYGSTAAGQPSAPPSYGSQQPAFGPVSAIPVGAAPRHGGGRGFRDRLPVLTGVSVIVLVIAVIVLLVLQINTVSQLHQSQRSLASHGKDIKSLQSGQSASNRRTSALEAQAKGTLNPSTVAKDVLPSVFRVQASNEIGTAFAIGDKSSNGGTLLVTNYHVIANEDKQGGTQVTLEQGTSTKYTGTIVQRDETHDLAVIEVTQDVPRLKAATTKIQPGDPVVAIGSPLGLTNTLTSGIVSGLRTVPGLESEGAKIQFDAAINPGNSGGPVVNAQGQVVGVAQIKIIGDDKTAEGLALAIPISQVCTDLISC